MSADLDLNKIFKVAKGVACAKGCSEFAEDIAQEVCIKAVELGFKPNIDWEISNLLRKEYGDLRTGAGRSKQRGTRYAMRLDAPANDESETLGHNLVGSEFIDPLPEPGIERFGGLFQGIECAVFDMIHIGEESGKTVAEVYGVSPGMISHIKRRIDKKIIKALVSPEEFPEEINFDLEDIAL